MARGIEYVARMMVRVAPAPTSMNEKVKATVMANAQSARQHALGQLIHSVDLRLSLGVVLGRATCGYDLQTKARSRVSACAHPRADATKGQTSRGVISDAPAPSKRSMAAHTNPERPARGR